MSASRRPRRHPRLYIMAGPNGAGKTTFAREFLPHDAKCENFVNADLITSTAPPALIAKEAGGTLTVADPDVFARILKNAER